MLPVAACAICPACLSTYAKLFSISGVGVSLPPTLHLLVLSLAVGTSLWVSVRRSKRVGRWWPAATAVAGCSALVLGHFAELSWLEYGGMGTLVLGGLLEQRALGHRHHRHPARPAPRPPHAAPFSPQTWVVRTSRLTIERPPAEYAEGSGLHRVSDIAPR